jgi:transcription termination factor Rho
MTLDVLALLAQPTSALRAQALARGRELPPLADRDEILRSLVEPNLVGTGVARTGGILELLPEGFGFLRAPAQDLQPSALDAYVSPAQVRRFHLQAGHWVEGLMRAPAHHERFYALVEVSAVQRQALTDRSHGLRFDARTAVLPRVPLACTAAAPGWLRAAALLAPWCRGQRVLLLTPPALDPARLLGDLALALAAAKAAPRLQVCLLDTAPEAIAPLRRLLAPQGIELLAASFEQPAARQLQLAELALARAMREVETGADVVLLFDSLSALARHHQAAGPQSGRWLCPGLDSHTMHAALRWFAAARQLEEGGSLTVLATATDSDTAVDRMLTGGLLRHAHSRLQFCPPSASGAPANAAPAAAPMLSIAGTATRPEDLALPVAAQAELQALRRRLLAIDDPVAAYDLLLALAAGSPAPA